MGRFGCLEIYSSFSTRVFLLTITKLDVSADGSGGCCQTASGIDGSFILVVSGLSVTDPE